MENLVQLFSYVPLFFMIVIRVLGLIIFFPILGSPVANTRMKIGLSYILAIVVFPMLQNRAPVIPASVMGLSGMIIKEFAIGVLLGYAASLLFAAIRFSGRFIGTLTGFAMLSMVDPMSQEQSSVIAQWQFILTTMVFLIVDGHHMLLSVVIDTFKIIPLGQINNIIVTFPKITEMLQVVFTLAIKISAPALALLFISSVVNAILAKAVPEMNVMIVTMPLKIVLGLFGLIMSIPLFIYLLMNYFGSLKIDIYTVLKLMGTPT